MNNKIPKLSGNDIEIKAEEVLTYFDKSLLKKAQFTPLASFMEQLQNEYGVLINFGSDLGSNEYGTKILGKFISKPRAIFVDKSIVDTERFPFTLAHEFGHMVFHRNLKIDKEDYSEITDTEYDLVSGKKILTSTRDWIEWQANKFASAILLPRATFYNALCDIQNKFGITKNVGYVYVSRKPYSLQDYNSVTNHLAQLYSVSKKSVEFRLKNLELLIDQRLMNVQHVSEMFKEE